MNHVTSLAHADAVGIVLGARMPVAPISRSETVRTRLAARAVAVLDAAARRRAAQLPAA